MWDWNGNGIDMFLNDAEMFNKSDYLNKKIPYDVRFIDAQQLKTTLKVTSTLFCSLFR